MLTEVFWMAFIGTVSAMVIKIASMTYKSKCKECSVCCIRVIRDIESEVKEDLELKQTQTENKESNS